MFIFIVHAGQYIGPESFLAHSGAHSAVISYGVK